MKNRINDETIEYVSVLAKLDLSVEEREQAKIDMTKMLDYIKKLEELDTEGIEPMSHTFSIQNVFREDKVINQNQREDMLKNAPDQKDGCFKVPGTINR